MSWILNAGDSMTLPTIHQTGPENTAPMLMRAALAVARASGVAATVADVVHCRALRHYGQALHQYVAIRLGNVEAATRLLEQLRAVAEARSAESMLAEPGVRAQLFRAARELVAHARNAPPSPEQLEALPWRPAASGVPRKSLVALRAELDEREAEMLELRHARELTPEEIAFVTQLAVEEVLEVLATATDRIQLRLARMGMDRTINLRRLLLETFALERLGATSTAEVNSGDLFERKSLAPGTMIGGRYKIARRAGTGAFGDVYKALDAEVPGHEVALKLLHQASFSDEGRASALRELHLIASVFHPSVVQFKDHGWHDERLWFVMPWYDGETLEERMKRGCLSRREALSIFQPLARALSAMHAAGIRHQDVKPDNVFLASIGGISGELVLPVLIDLGVAAKEAEMVVAGTPTYFAPEVAAQFTTSITSKPRVTCKSDIFALALCLRNALEPETQVDVPAGAVEAFIDKRAESTPELAEAPELRFLDESFERWMALDASERPSADELVTELEILVAPEKRRRRRRALRRRLVPTVAGLTVAFAAAASMLYLRAESERLDAERARLEAVEIQADLVDTQRDRARIAADARQIRSRFALSEQNGEQLAGELARTEGQLGHMEGELGRVRETLSAREERQRRLRESLNRTQGSLEEAHSSLALEQARLLTTETDLAETQRRATSAAEEAVRSEREAARHLRELRRARGELHAVEERETQLSARLATLEVRFLAETAKGERLEVEVEAAIAGRAQAVARITRLERQLDRLNAATEATTGEPASPAPDEEPLGDS